MDGSKVQPGVRKIKEKHKNNELDRIKHAERKKRRLEKALAASAAIRSELEKKKQKKQEEQQRLDEEGASIAEAVALHVLLDDGLDDSCSGLHMKDGGLNQWDYRNRFDLLTGGSSEMVPQQNISRYSKGEIGLVSDGYRYGYTRNDKGNYDLLVSSVPLGGNFHVPYMRVGDLETTGISAGLAAAQAFSLLNIGEETSLDSYVFNQMLRG